MVDFSDRAFWARSPTRSRSRRIERKMARRGYLEGGEMAGTFDMLRANDLIFNYVVSNWLLGQQPPAFDILAWNADSTRMPAAMHSFYLRSATSQNQWPAARWNWRAAARSSRTCTRTSTSWPRSTTTCAVDLVLRHDQARVGDARFILSRRPHRRHRQRPAPRAGTSPPTRTRRRNSGAPTHPHQGSVVGGLAPGAPSAAGDMIDPPRHRKPTATGYRDGRGVRPCLTGS
jgi:hypothetical protein